MSTQLKMEATGYRTGGCGELTITDEGSTVTLSGWVNSRRDHGGLIFVDLRDRSGKVQIVFSPEKNAEALAIAETLRSEFVIKVTGTVLARAEELKNPKLATGEIEVGAESVEILAKSETPPFDLDGDDVAEDTRLKWRFVDLRRPKMLSLLGMRHRAIAAVRSHLTSHGFWEIETPLLGKSTPEGARDYLVPSRVSQGKFYALPQSPQLYKQLLMVAGVDRYYQIAKCCRDEDSRADRQPEFTQIDLEMSFASLDDVLGVTEGLIAGMFEAGIGAEIPQPFKRLTHAECMEKYGDDKPDLRFDLEIQDATDLAKSGEFIPFTRTLDEGGVVKALRAVGWGSKSRKEIDLMIEKVRNVGAGGMAWARVKDGSLDGGVAKNFPDEAKRAFVTKLEAVEGDMVVIVADQKKPANAALSLLRNEIGASNGWQDKNKFSMLWVVDFPLFSWNEDAKRWDSEHHPFTAPHPEDVEFLETDPSKVRSLSYDLVINGSECASGSVRIHSSDVQRKIFELLNLSDEDIDAKFGFFNNALKYGAPPHAGIAPGVDRIMAIMGGVESIRDVIAFPKTQRGLDLMTGAPSYVDAAQLTELSLEVDMPEDATEAAE